MKQAYQPVVAELMDVSSDILTESGDVLLDASVFDISAV